MKFLLKCLLPLIPLVAYWIRREERKILRLGSGLTTQALADAVHLGVMHPDKIRVIRVERIPLVNGWLVRGLARIVPAISSDTIGLCLRYGIYLRASHGEDRELIAHECVHTAQYERYGEMEAFLRAYFRECIDHGYPGAPLEREAIRKAEALVAIS